MTKDDFPSFNRTSKLKRRRRNPADKNISSSTTTSLESNPLKRFAAEPVAKSSHLSCAAGGGSSSNVATVANNDNDTTFAAATHIQNWNENAAGDYSPLVPPPAVSTILNLDNVSSRHNGKKNRNLMSSKMIAAQIDYYIAASYEYTIMMGRNNQEQEKKQQQQLLYGTRNALHHATLGMIRVRNQDEKDKSLWKNAIKDFCPIAFPQVCTQSSFDLSKRRRNISNTTTFQSGDGVVVDSNLLRLPTISNSNEKQTTNKSLKYIKIITKLGATVRTNYDIDEKRKGSSSIGSTTSEVIGKLHFGAIRPVVECKCLEKPSLFSMKKVWSEDEGLWHEEEASDEELEEELVGVMRYKVCLLPSDIILSHNGAGDNIDKDHIVHGMTHGWISDRSRLKSQPYQIAEIIE